MGAEMETLEPIERNASNAALDQVLGVGAHEPIWADIECKWCADGCPGHPKILTCRDCDVDWPCDVAASVAAELDRLGTEHIPLGDDVENEEDQAYDDGRAFVAHKLRRRASELRGEA